MALTILSIFAIMSVFRLDLGGIRIMFDQIYQAYL
jgi:hypothetical protein